MAAKQNVKRRIVDAAWELFYEKGYDDTTVDDIIRLSETSKGSFYYYFNTKDELLNTLSIILDDNYEVLRRIAESRHCLVRGSELDVEKAAAILLDDFRNGRLGRLTLELPEEN